MRLSDHDASFLYRETLQTPMHGATISVIEGVVDFEVVYQKIAAKVHRFPLYRKKLAFVPLAIAHPKWVDDPDFDLSKHVKQIQLNDDATIDTVIAESLKVAASLLPRSRPMWAIYAIYGVADRTILLHLAHNALSDGAPGVDIADILFDLQKNPTATPQAAPDWQPEPLQDALMLATEAVGDNMQKYARSSIQRNNASEDNTELLRRGAETLTRFLAEPVVSAPWNSRAVSQRRDFAWRRYPFADVRKIRNKLGGTANDVVLAILVEASARYLQQSATETAGKHFRVLCPVNVRRQDEKGARSTRVSGTLPIFNAEPMPMAERLKNVRWETESLKQNREAQALQLLADLAPPTPPLAMMGGHVMGLQPQQAPSVFQFIQPLVANFFPTPPSAVNFTCTNLPGVQTTQYLDGHQVLEHLTFPTLRDNLGFGVAIGSYDQQISFNLICDPTLIPEIDQIANYLDEAFAELAAQAASISSPRALSQ